MLMEVVAITLYIAVFFEYSPFVSSSSNLKRYEWGEKSHLTIFIGIHSWREWPSAFLRFLLNSLLLLITFADCIFLQHWTPLRVLDLSLVTLVSLVFTIMLGFYYLKHNKKSDYTVAFRTSQEFLSQRTDNRKPFQLFVRLMRNSRLVSYAKFPLRLNCEHVTVFAFVIILYLQPSKSPI